jgi:molybdopterin biosynthesis enzyme
MLSKPTQLLTRLAPLHEAFACIDAIAMPVPARKVAVIHAAGQVLAADVTAARPLPPHALALCDGWAVESHRVSDAGSYAPIPLMPPPTWVDAGTPLPDGADAVLAPEAVVMANGMAEAIGAASAGDNVLPAGADAGTQPLRRAGERLRESDIAALRALGVSDVQVHAPRIRIVPMVPGAGAAAVISTLVAEAIGHGGGAAGVTSPAGMVDLAADGSDAFITIGGTGAGRQDRSVTTLAGLGEVAMHGIGIRPGETSALATVRSRPVLMLPGRLDAALAAWLVLGTRVLARLTGFTTPDPLVKVVLSRKIVSTIGLAEVIPVGLGSDGVEPLASGYFPLQALTRATGWVFVPPESEGFAAGTEVALHRLP